MGVIAVGDRNSLLNAYARGTNFAGHNGLWVKLHIGDPGASGTSNPAANTTRKEATFANAAVSGSIATTNTVIWTAIPNAETYTHVSLWTAATGGSFLGSDDLSASATVAVNDSFEIPIGSLVVTIT